MVQSFVEMFNQLKTVHCMCPNCDGLMRVSDLKLISKEKTEKTWLDVFDDNYRARHVYRSVGFRDEGVLREAALKSDSRFGSLAVMSILASEYRSG